MDQTQIGRLAFRVEGEWWNAYWAPYQDSMAEAVHLGSIRMNLAADLTVKAAFMSAMRHAFSRAVQNAIGVKPSWDGPTAAPEHERAGRD